jgi:hypothetical protein
VIVYVDENRAIFSGFKISLCSAEVFVIMNSNRLICYN